MLTGTTLTAPAGADRRPARPDRPRVLLIPNVSGWILGEICKTIISELGSRYEFHFATELVLRHRPDLLRRLVSQSDVVHALSDSAARLILNSGLRRRPPLITSIHHVTEWTANHQRVFDGSDAIVAPTDDWARQLAVYGGSESRVHRVRYGIDPGFFSPKAPERGRFGIPADSFAVGFVGAKASDEDGNRKGLDTLAEVLRLLRAGVPNLHVCLVGQGWEKEVLRLRRLGLSVSNPGFLPRRDLPVLYSSLDALLMTSRVEGGPCTILEAMACRCPVVATRVGLVPYVVEPGVNGFSRPADDAAGLASDLAALAASGDLGLRTGRAARETVSRAWDWSQTLGALDSLYERLSAGRPTGPGEDVPAPGVAAMCAVDSFLWTLALARRGRVSVREGARMLLNLWSDLPVAKAPSALRLIAGTAVRAVFRRRPA